MAYGALANGGLLMEPRLVREVRFRDGRVEHSHPPRVVRRVVPETAARSVADALRGAVETGTARAAQLGPYTVAGKTGTTRVARGGSYRQGAYIASFAGFFPAEDPQLVFLVKIDEPTGSYYGGAAAAPVTRAAIEGALALHSSPVDRSAVATASVDAAALPALLQLEAAAVEPDPVPMPARSTPFVLAVRRGEAAAAEEEAAAAGVVPDVSGLPLRDAVRRLHAAGFLTRVEGSGAVRATVPAAGQRGAVVVRVIGAEAWR
jgi:membrane peptidoglycan carboxypeptidase